MADQKLYLTDFEERRQKIRRRWRLGLLVLGVAMVLFGGTWFLLWSPVFRVQEVRVEGISRLPADDVRQFVQDIVMKHSRLARWFGADYIFAWPNEIAGDDLVDLPKARTLRIQTSIQDRIAVVTVVERGPYGIWCLMKHNPPACSWFEEDGTVFEPAPEAEGTLIRVVRDYATENIAFNASVLPGIFLPHLRGVFDVLDGSGFAPREVRYEDPGLQELRVLTYEGPELFFSLRFSPAYALSAIQNVREKDAAGTLFPRLRDMQYIDFRVENRAYYR